ncbi:hypothetical protein Tco_0741924, partial [Tanacetum coccineum]
GIFCQQCTCASCGNGAHYGYNCPPKVPIISNPEPCNNQTINELPQTLPSFDPTCYSGDGSSFTYDSTPNVFDPPSQQPTYSCEFYGNDAHYGYDCLPKVPFIYNLEPCYNQDFNFPQNFQEEQAANIDQSPPQEMSIQDMEDLKQHYLDEMKSLINDLQIKDYCNERIDIQYRRECKIRIDELKQNFNIMSIEIRKKEKELLQQEQAAYVRTSQRFNFIYYDDDEDEESSIPLSNVIFELPPYVAITPVLSTEELDNSLSMGDEHLDTIPATKSDEVIKSSVEDLVPIPSESEGIFDKICDVPFRDNSPPLDISKDQFEDFSDSNDDSTSIDDDSFSIDNIDYVEASPPHSVLVSLEEVKDFYSEDGELEDDILREKLSKINLLIAKIEALKDNPTPSSNFVTKL